MLREYLGGRGGKNLEAENGNKCLKRCALDMTRLSQVLGSEEANQSSSHALLINLDNSRTVLQNSVAASKSKCTLLV